MNKRVLNKVLLISLVVIWSVIAYRFLNNFKGKSTETIAEISVLSKQSMVAEKEVFLLPEKVKDPFLNTIQIKKVDKKPVRQTVISSNKNKAILWPSIEYYGFIQSENKQSPLVLLKINQKMYRFRKGESKEKITILNIYKDSVQLSLGKEKRVFFKKN